MTDETEKLVLEHLQAIRAQLDRHEANLAALNQRMAAMAEALTRDLEARRRAFAASEAIGDKGDGE